MDCLVTNRAVHSHGNGHDYNGVGWGGIYVTPMVRAITRVEWSLGRHDVQMLTFVCMSLCTPTKYGNSRQNKVIKIEVRVEEAGWW